MSENQEKLQEELAKIEQAIAAQEALRGVLSDKQIETLMAPLRAQQTTLHARLEGSGAIAQDGSVAVGSGVGVGRDVHGGIIDGDGNIQAEGPVVIVGDGASGTTVVIGETPVKMTAVKRKSALGRYLQNIISRNRYLQLQGIRSGGKLVHIELDRIYITLRATHQRLVEREEEWLAEEAKLAPGELRRMRGERHLTTGTTTVSVNEALAQHHRLVVLGDPGSGKTTLLRYLALLYARDLAEGGQLVEDKLGLAESRWLPLLFPLRQIGAFINAHHGTKDGTEGHRWLLDYIRQVLENERIDVPDDFFDEWLTQGKAVVLLDGLDEVADPDLRQRVSRLVEAFTRAYPDCRYVVTSRIVGYTGAARLGEDYATTTVRDFNMADVERFLQNWHRLIAIGQMGAGTSAEAYASEQTRQLKEAIEANERIRELAINPLMLTVIAMVHRDRVKLPDRRAELYTEAVDVLLGKWEEAKGLAEIAILEGEPFDTGDRRLMLQSIALNMHESEQKEVSAEMLKSWLGEMFYAILGEWRAVDRVVERFIQVIEERTGLLVARGEGIYAFSHLTFQEYLAALAVAGRDDYIPYTLERVPDAWWREVVLLEAGYLSMQSRERTTKLIQAIADLREEPELYHNLVLASDCLRDVGANRVRTELAKDVQTRLRLELETKPPVWARWLPGRPGIKGWIERRSAAMEALVRSGAGFWTQPNGEPEWVEVPAGSFWMGDDSEQHQISLPTFFISRTPITNAQYHLFVQATKHGVPGHWEDDRPPKGLESHPVVNVNWRDAMTYCEWLSKKIEKSITPPSEAEWGKAARGDKDKRIYPWGDTFESTRCNSSDLGLGTTTPVGIFSEGASPYGCLDMSGNVWEWCLSKYVDYPYLDDNRNIVDESDDTRVVRGGAFGSGDRRVRCAFRNGNSPRHRNDLLGFRVVFSPSTTGH